MRFVTWRRWVGAAGSVITVVLGSCANSSDQRLYEKPTTFDSYAQAGSVHLAVLSVAPWQRYATDMSPNFQIDGKTAFDQVMPITQKIEDRILDAWAAQLAVSAGGTAISKTKTITTDESGEKKASSTETQTTSSGSLPGIGGASTTGGADDKSGDKTADKPSSPIGGNFNSNSAPGLLNKAADKNTAPQWGETLPVEPMLRYQAATALYQEVQMLNRYVRDAASREGMNAYLVRMQVSTMPSARNEPYDAYVTLSFFTGENSLDVDGKVATPRVELPSSDKREDNQCVVVPLLVTDNLEAALRLRSVETLRKVLLAAEAMIKGIAVGGQVERKFDALSTGLGEDLNSLLTVARVSDNTLRVRLGAMQQGTVRYAMVPRTHNITAVVLAPKRFNEVRVVSYSEFINATTGIRTQGGRWQQRAFDESLRNRIQALIDEHFGEQLSKKYNKNVSNAVRSQFCNDIIWAVLTSDTKLFDDRLGEYWSTAAADRGREEVLPPDIAAQETVLSQVEKSLSSNTRLFDQMSARQVVDKITDDLKADPTQASRPVVSLVAQAAKQTNSKFKSRYDRVWLDLTHLAVASPYGYTRFTVNALNPALPPLSQNPSFIESDAREVALVLAGGKDLTNAGLHAYLNVPLGNPNTRTIQVEPLNILTNDNRVRLVFPSLRRLGLDDELTKDAPLLLHVGLIDPPTNSTSASNLYSVNYFAPPKPKTGSASFARVTSTSVIDKGTIELADLDGRFPPSHGPIDVNVSFPGSSTKVNLKGVTITRPLAKGQPFRVRIEVDNPAALPNTDIAEMNVDALLIRHYDGDPAPAQALTDKAAVIWFRDEASSRPKLVGSAPKVVLTENDQHNFTADAAIAVEPPVASNLRSLFFKAYPWMKPGAFQAAIRRKDNPALGSITVPAAFSNEAWMIDKQSLASAVKAAPAGWLPDKDKDADFELTLNVKDGPSLPITGTLKLEHKVEDKK